VLQNNTALRDNETQNLKETPAALAGFFSFDLGAGHATVKVDSQQPNVDKSPAVLANHSHGQGISKHVSQAFYGDDCGDNHFSRLRAVHI
jgi:hypothetical protein